MSQVKAVALRLWDSPVVVACLYGVWVGLLAAAVLVLMTAGVFGGEPVRHGPPVRPELPHKCVTCGFDCQCGSDCKCPQVGKTPDLRAAVEAELAAVGKYRTARVREPDVEPAVPKAGSTKLIGGYWYKLRSDGWWEWCSEFNGYPYPAARPTTATYLPRAHGVQSSLGWTAGPYQCAPGG